MADDKLNLPAQCVVTAAERLLAGGLVAFPTETVWGLGADAENPDAIAKIYKAKGRPANHPVIVHLPAHADINYWASSVPPEAVALMDAFWPGPLTIILPRATHIPVAVSGGQSSIGLRCPSHPVAQALLAQFAALKPGGQGGVAAPSANKFGKVSPTSADHVRNEFADLQDHELLVLDAGASDVGIESTIVDLSRIGQGMAPVLLRPGHITAAQLADVLGRPIAGVDLDAPRVSGSLKAHYAPRTPVHLVSVDELRQYVGPENQTRGLHAPTTQTENVVILSRSARPAALPVGTDWLAMPAEAPAYARRLYAALREVDNGRYVQILIEQPPRSVAWQAINDRLGRAVAAFYDESGTG